MEFDDEEQNRNETDHDAAPAGRKGPNLLKNRNKLNEPVDSLKTETTPEPADNDYDDSAVYSSSDNSDFPPDENDIPAGDDGGFENFENNSSSSPPDDKNNDSDVVPDENDIPDPSDDFDEFESYEDYSSRSSQNDDDSESGIVSDIDTETPDPNDPPPLSTIEPEPDAPEPYKPPDKTSPDAVMGGMKPLKLNRQLILFAMLGFFCLSFLFVSFIMPALQQKKAEETAKRKKLEQIEQTDYSLYARQKKPEYSSNGDSYPYSEDTDLQDVFIPDPFDYQYQQQQPQPNARQQTIPSGTGGGVERPDTRNDRLQGKSISGIKGLSSSRQNYAAPDQTSPLTSVQGVFSDNMNNPYAQFGMPPKDEYLQSMLSQYANPQTNNSYASQNNQNDKVNFVNQKRENSGGGQWLPVNSVWQGTIFEATLTSNINTDLPGECTAWVTKNVYSSLDGRFLLIPQNSRLFGSYNSSISYSQSRVQIGWHTLIRPDGYMINLGNMQATDPQGAAGLKGFVNDHPFAYLKALGLITALNLANAQFNATIADNQNQYVQNVLADTQQMTNLLSAKIIDRALDIQPTIVIKSGIKINIVANQTLILPPLTPYGVTKPYHRGE